jgi:voltage-gated potassium channel Kch
VIAGSRSLTGHRYSSGVRSFRRGPLLWTTLTAVVAFVLGYLGYRDSLSGGLDRLDAIYRTMQLFAMDSQPEPNAPWELRVARFIAPLSLATAAVVAAALFFRDHYQRLLIGVFAREHVVVVGLSESSGAVAEAMVDFGERVVVVEADAQHPRLPGLRAVGALCVVGDGRQAVILRRARVERARRIVIATGDDTRNLDVADQVRAARSTESSRHTTVHVAIDDLPLWLEVGRLAFSRGNSGTSFECFNKSDRTAQRLVDTAASSGRFDRVAVLGGGPVTDRVKAHLIRRAALRGEAVDIASAPDNDVSMVIVGDVEHNVADAIALTRAHSTAHVVVALDTDTADTLLGLLGPLADRLHVVPATSASLATGLLRDSAVEIMARAKHDDYVELERAKGLTVVDNPSLVGWDGLPESLRDSNRRFAASVAQTLGDIGASLSPLQSGSDISELPLSTDQLEHMAIKEHDRWEADLRKDGWTYAGGPKDPVAKTHPLLVPWDELSEEEREKDRDAIRAIPRMLARVGYALAV